MQDNMKVILFTTLLLFSVNGFAFNWKPIIKNQGGDIIYVDVDNIKTHNGFVYYWQLMDYLEPNKYLHYSAISKFKVNCKKNEIIHLSIMFYERQMGKGKKMAELLPNNVIVPQKKSVADYTLKFVCSY